MRRSDLTDLLYPVFNSCGPGDITCNPDFYKICVHCIYVLDMKLVLFNLLTYSASRFHRSLDRKM